MYMYIYIHIHTYTYIHTYIHTCKVHNCSQSFPNVYIHRAVGFKTGPVPADGCPCHERPLISAMDGKICAKSRGSKCSPLLPPPDAHAPDFLSLYVCVLPSISSRLCSQTTFIVTLSCSEFSDVVLRDKLYINALTELPN